MSQWVNQVFSLYILSIFNQNKYLVKITYFENICKVYFYCTVLYNVIYLDHIRGQWSKVDYQLIMYNRVFYYCFMYCYISTAVEQFLLKLPIAPPMANTCPNILHEQVYLVMSGNRGFTFYKYEASAFAVVDLGRFGGWRETAGLLAVLSSATWCCPEPLS